jgi:uncharacterized protein (DUF58 family)
MIAPSLHPDPVRAACEPRGRLAFGLTPRAVLLVAAGLLLILPGFFQPLWGAGFFVWELLLSAAVVLDALRLPAASRITLERSWSNAPALDSETEIELRVTQSGGTLLECRLVDDLPEALVGVPAVHLLRAFPRTPAALRYRLRPRARGDVRTGFCFLRYRSLVGLIEFRAKAPLEQTVRIYPALRQGENQQIYLARGRQIDLQLRQLRQRGLGRDFESLREYREGDDLRDVCWTATARRGELVTRQYQTERSQAVWIVLDAGRLLRARVQPTAANPHRQDHSKLDHACSTAVALAQLVLYSGDRVGLLVYGQKIQQRVLPGRGSAHLRQIVEALSQAEAEAGEADHLRATAILNRLQPRRALILWVTDLAETSMRPEVVDGALQLLHRHVLLFVAMGQPDVEEIARSTPRDVAGMFRAAAAQELQSRRELLLARLRDQGALTLDLHPEKLTAAVLNHYLMVKERAML